MIISEIVILLPVLLINDRACRTPNVLSGFCIFLIISVLHGETFYVSTVQCFILIVRQTQQCKNVCILFFCLTSAFSVSETKASITLSPPAFVK